MTECVHSMRLSKFVPHEKFTDFYMDESEFYANRNMVDCPNFFLQQTESTKNHPEVAARDSEDLDHENLKIFSTIEEPGTP